ncbi:MAG: FAD-binding oxidoreductase [Solirubrobacterales bacterium]
MAVVPFGGGTSVVGGVAPLRERHGSVIALDLCALRTVEVDHRSMLARLGPGLRGPEAEAALESEGLTLGHFPQSFAYATIGGFAATRSAGQASSGYGRFDELVASLALTSPIGEMTTLATPHTAAGPSLRELALGSEGTLGVLTGIVARVRRSPEKRRYEAWVVPGFEEGADAVRVLAQSGRLPDVVRLSDASETEIARSMAGGGGARARLLDAYLGARRRSDGCALIVGWEGAADSVERRRALAAGGIRDCGGVAIGQAPGRSWHRGRYEGPYLRDQLLDLGVMAETLETAHTWSDLANLYAAVRRAIETALDGQGTPGIVMCHLSHAYPDGASLYFTFIARQKEGAELEQWRAVKSAASTAIVEAGGTITHHHAVGRDHAPYMRAELGPVGLQALHALKDRLDPAGIMNPGKLLPD